MCITYNILADYADGTVKQKIKKSPTVCSWQKWKSSFLLSVCSFYLSPSCRQHESDITAGRTASDKFSNPKEEERGFIYANMESGINSLQNLPLTPHPHPR